MSDRSHGCRPGRGSHTALAQAIAIAEATNRWVWISQDLKDAFPIVPVQPLYEVLVKHFVEPKMRQLLRTIIMMNNRGISQGFALSPLLLNIYLDHHLDRPWAASQPGSSLLRYVDDLLLLCGSFEEAGQLHTRLGDRLVSTGFKLKHSVESAVSDIQQSPVTWLGFNLLRAQSKMIIAIPETAWGRLEKAIKRSHGYPDSRQHTLDVLRSWFAYYAPAFQMGNDPANMEAAEQTRQLAAQNGISEVPSHARMVEYWGRRYAQWVTVLDQARSAGTC